MVYVSWPMGHVLARDVTASGVRLRVSEWPVAPGSRAEPTVPVVLLHGLFAPRASWQGLAERMAQGFRVIAPDLPGFGESEKPAPSRYPYDIPAFAEAVVDLFGGLDIGRAHLVGHGLGGAIALHIAARHPELVSRLALIAPLCYATPLHPRLRVAAAPLVGGLLFKQLLGRRAFRAFYGEWVNGTLSATDVNQRYESFNTPAGRSALLAVLRSNMDTRTVVADSRLIKAPTLVLWGNQDRMLPPSFGRQLAKEIPSAGLELVDAEHAPHEEAPEAVQTVLSRFLTGQRAGSR